MPTRTKEMVAARVQKILEAARKRRDFYEVQLVFEGFAEPGYSEPECGIIALSDWNSSTYYQNGEPVEGKTMPVVCDLFEKLGVEIEWSDEWETCSQCGKLVRCEADSYGWMCSYWEGDGEIHCIECVQEDPSEYLEWLEGNQDACMTIDGIKLEDHGYRLLESNFEHGFHSGQDADPRVIAKSLRKLGVERFIFSIDSAGQFDVSFSVWVHKDELVDRRRWAKAKKNGPSVSEGLKRALQSASAAMAKLPDGQGIKVAKCDASTGTATVKIVSPEDFVAGRALD